MSGFAYQTGLRQTESEAPVCDIVLSLYCEGLVQRCVIIQKDENGFGLTVSGDNPVFVQLVKEGKVNSPPQWK